MTTRIVDPPVLLERRAHRFLALAVICLAELLVVLDNTIVNVALPSIGVELSTGSAACSGSWTDRKSTRLNSSH